MSLLLIDDQGEIWSGDLTKLKSALDAPYAGGEFSEFVVLNLGFVALNLYGTSCQMRLRPSLMTPLTLRALLRWLQINRCERMVITSYESHWNNELVSTPVKIASRIEALVSEARRVQPNDFLVDSLEAADLSDRDPLGQILTHWPRLAQPSGQHELMRLLEDAIGDRYVAVKRDDILGRMVFHEVGDGLFWNYETWRTCAVGAPIEEQPDRQYGRWVSNAYRETSQILAPRIDNVDALVRWPHAGKTRLRYKRIIVPIKTPASGELLIGGSIMDSSIDLRQVTR